MNVNLENRANRSHLFRKATLRSGWELQPLIACCCVCVAACVASARAEVRVPHVFSDHMVLQRNAEIPVWGWAEPGETVQVQLDGEPPIESRADSEGRWRIALPTGEADSRPRILSILGSESAEAIALQDVLLGEVWLCSGQSNMQWPVKLVDDAQSEIAAANWPLIRHLNVPQNASSIPQEDQPSVWEVCSPSTVGEFTGVGYFFAQRLHQELGVPIGLLNATWGGTRIEPWTPVEGFDFVPELEQIRQRVLLQDPRTQEHKQRAALYLDEAENWLAAQRTSRTAVPLSPLEAPPALPPELLAFSNRQDPSALYNGMIHPLVPYRIRGSIWYQGEANSLDDDYYEKSVALVKGWRAVWQEDLPFFYVQIAPWHYRTNAPHFLPSLWQQQERLERTLINTAMVVISDIGNVSDIHPRNKQDVGKRLADVALQREYQQEGLTTSGPRASGMSVSGNQVRVTFHHAESGLAARDGQPLNEFELIGPGTGWRSASASIQGKAVVLESPDVPHPTAVRLAWHKSATTNLMNGVGLPAAAFQIGDIPDEGPLIVDVKHDGKYSLLYDLNLLNLGTHLAFDQDHRGQITGAFDRVAYFLELKKPGEPLQWIYVAMDAFTDDLGKLGIPTSETEAFFQQPVERVYANTNNPNAPAVEGETGYLEFWPNSYGPKNTASVPGASDTDYDYGDAPNLERPTGYGSMQVHLPQVKQTVFSINHWSEGLNADLGMGNRAEGHPDWTFAGNASEYEVARLRVLIREVNGEVLDHSERSDVSHRQ